MLISFHLPTLFVPGSSPVENAKALQALLECLIAIDAAHLVEHPKTPKLYDPKYGVRYGRTDEWMTIPSMYLAGKADCKSLTAMRIAELRREGKIAKPVFRFRKNQSGGTDYHILVQDGAGSFEDPSKILGMGQSEWAHFQR